MKKILLLLVAVVSLTTANAQQGGGKGGPKMTAEQRAQKSVDNLDQTVTLTADQKTQVYNLALARAQKVDAIRAKYKGQPDQRETAKSEMKAAHKEYAQAVKPLLTADQIAKLKAKHQERKASKGNKGKAKNDGAVSDEELIPEGND